MRADAIVEAVARKTLSPDHDDTVILEIINRGLVEIAGGGDREHGAALVAPLPGLLTADDVTLEAGDISVAMPEDFQRGLVRVSVGGEPLKRMESIHALLKRYDGEAGIPEGYVIKGNTLWLMPAPSANTDVDLYYHRLPAALSATGTPEGIPEHLQYKLLFNYACREIFSDIEQGLEGKSPDTLKYDALYNRALTDLERFIGPEDGEPTNVGDENTDDYIL